MEKLYIFIGIMLAYLAVYLYFCYRTYFKRDESDCGEERQVSTDSRVVCDWVMNNIIEKKAS